MPQIERVAKKRSPSQASLQQEFPDEPWRWRKDWVTGVVPGTARKEAVFFLVAGALFLGLSLPATLAIPEELERGNHAILLVLLFTLVGLGFGWAAINRWDQFRRFGALSLRLDPFPGSWGGRVGGVLEIPRGAWISGDVKVKLHCRRYVKTGSGKQRRTRETVLWETDQVLSAQRWAGMGQVKSIPIEFVVERDRGEPSDPEVDENYVDWKLRVTAPVRGRRRPLQMEFAIPVFDRGDDLDAAAGLTARQKAELEDRKQDALAEAGVRREMIAGEEVWSFHQPTAKKHSLALIGFGGIFAAVAWWVPVLIMQLAFGGFALLMFAIVPGIIWHRSELRIGEREVVLRKRGIRGWKSWRIPGEEIGSLALSESMRSGDVRYLRLKAIGVPGVDPEKPHPAEHFRARKARYRWQKENRGGGTPSEATLNTLLETPCFEIELAGYLEGTREAEAVKELLERRLGLAGD